MRAFLFVCFGWLCGDDIKFSPYTLLILRWISAALRPSACRKRITLRNSHLAGASIVATRTSAMTDALEPTTAEVVVGELRNHATRRSGSRVFRSSLEARSEVEKKTALVHDYEADRTVPVSSKYTYYLVQRHEQYRQCTYNITLKNIRATIMQRKSNKYYMF